MTSEVTLLSEHALRSGTSENHTRASCSEKSRVSSLREPNVATGGRHDDSDHDRSRLADSPESPQQHGPWDHRAAVFNSGRRTELHRCSGTHRKFRGKARISCRHCGVFDVLLFDAIRLDANRGAGKQTWLATNPPETSSLGSERRLSQKKSYISSEAKRYCFKTSRSSTP